MVPFTPITLTILVVACLGVLHLACSALRPSDRRAHAACACACLLTCAAMAHAVIGGVA